MNNPISEIEDLYKYNKKDRPIILPTPPEVMRLFNETFKMNYAPEKLYVTSAVIKSILDSVRNIIFEWSLKLEEDGILGENLTFSIEEKEKANEQITNYNTLIYGVHSSPIQVGQYNTQNITINIGESKELLKSIEKWIDKLELKNSDEIELKSKIKVIESQLESPEPNSKILKEGFKSIKTILESSAGNVIAQGLIFGITKLLGM